MGVLLIKPFYQNLSFISSSVYLFACRKLIVCKISLAMGAVNTWWKDMLVIISFRMEFQEIREFLECFSANPFFSLVALGI
jgi:hypothetical protein